MIVEPALHLVLIDLFTRKNVSDELCTTIEVNLRLCSALEELISYLHPNAPSMLSTTTAETDLAYGGRVSQSGTELGFARSDGIEHPVNETGSPEYRAYCRAQTEVCLKHIMPGLRTVWLSDAGEQSRQCVSRIEQPENRVWIPAHCIAVGSDADATSSVRMCFEASEIRLFNASQPAWSTLIRMIVVLSNGKQKRLDHMPLVLYVASNGPVERSLHTRRTRVVKNDDCTCPNDIAGHHIAVDI
jgi:hypothetical protein